jgi:hypothetical protein
MEITGYFDTPDLFVDYPTEAEWDEIMENGECAALASRYLGRPLDSFGRFGASGLRPFERDWKLGERGVWCAISASGPGDDDEQYEPLIGSAVGQDQTFLYGREACVERTDDGDLGNAVPCSMPHVLEITGSVDLTGGGDQLPADDAAWDAAVGDECARLAWIYLGREPRDESVRPSWLYIEPGSWEAGRRVVECTVARYAPDGNAVAVTGPLRDQVT